MQTGGIELQRNSTFMSGKENLYEIIENECITAALNVLPTALHGHGTNE